MNYSEFTQIMRSHNNNGGLNIFLRGRVVISEKSFDVPLSEDERTFCVSNDNKAFISGMGGYSIFASPVTGRDLIRLDYALKEEHGGENGWEVDYCYFLNADEKVSDASEMKKILNI